MTDRFLLCQDYSHLHMENCSRSIHFRNWFYLVGFVILFSDSMLAPFVILETCKVFEVFEVFEVFGLSNASQGQRLPALRP